VTARRRRRPASALWWTTLLVSSGLVVRRVLESRASTAAARARSDAVDEATLARLASGEPLSPVAVVIAAYNEATGLEAVLRAIPPTLCGLPVDVVVVDDGSSDGTAEVASRAERTLVVRCGSNRGQGAALRLGYRVARERGARFILTTDADGQYDPADMEGVLEPVVSGTADFASGSRVLGAHESHDLVRRTGVHVFAWTVRVLTGGRVTDTSFGLRAMRAEITGSVTLTQPQYQSAELLIGVLSRGFRVVEVPARMRARGAGRSKKGNNLVYGGRYARVVLGTWWREGRPRSVSEGRR